MHQRLHWMGRPRILAPQGRASSGQIAGRTGTFPRLKPLPHIQYPHTCWAVLKRRTIFRLTRHLVRANKFRRVFTSASCHKSNNLAVSLCVKVLVPAMCSMVGDVVICESPRRRGPLRNPRMGTATCGKNNEAVLWYLILSPYQSDGEAASKSVRWIIVVQNLSRSDQMHSFVWFWL